MLRGAVITIVGCSGLRGAWTLDVLAGDAGFKAQVAALPEQNALNSELRKVTASPARKYLAALAASSIMGKDTLTVLALSHVHLDREALTKAKSRSHCQVASSMPPLSVGELKLIVTV
jgi:hypothetical protein